MRPSSGVAAYTEIRPVTAIATSGTRMAAGGTWVGSVPVTSGDGAIIAGIRPASFVGGSEDENMSRFAAGGAVGLARGPHHRARPTNHGRSTMISCGSQCNTDSYANAAEALRQVDRRIPALISARRRANGHQSDHSPPTGVAAFRCSRGRSGAGSFADVRCRHRACLGGVLPTGHCRRSWSASCIGRGFRSPEAAGCPWTAARRHEFARCVQQNLINIHEPSICGHAAEL